MIAAIPSLATALLSATSMRGSREEMAAVRTVFMTRGPLLKEIAWICQYQKATKQFCAAATNPGATAD
jgi:spore germination cell wall hydrolase CwlJ-like protein